MLRVLLSDASVKDSCVQHDPVVFIHRKAALELPAETDVRGAVSIA
jgi:hypothetical protein